LITGGLQDNANLYSLIEPSPTPWKNLGCGDGGYMAFLRTGDLLAECTTGYDASRTRWNGTQFAPPTPVPILNGAGSLNAGFEVVSAPARRNQANQLMYAVGWSAASVYGLFAETNGNNMHWELLGSVPVGPNQYITALGSSDGFTVFVGTSEGKTFALDSRSGSRVELNIPIGSNPPGVIGKFAVASTTQAFAILNPGSIGFILRLNGFRWDAVGGGTFFALEMDRTTNPPTLFAATDSRVYVSRDGGVTWQSASIGLPRRSHCADLRFVAQTDGRRYLYLSTYGRSVWRARL
jgi:hypothetical protein